MSRSLIYIMSYLRKSDILDPESDNAMEVALAETHVIPETKTYLESPGVFFPRFLRHIGWMFAMHGRLVALLCLLLAVVKFVHTDEANGAAFRAIRSIREFNLLGKGRLHWGSSKKRWRRCIGVHDHCIQATWPSSSRTSHLAQRQTDL